MSENIHTGHRNRLREEIISADINQSRPPVKLLEMLLFYGIVQKDTAKIAHDLILEFGDICGVFEADIDDLLKIKGMTRNAASLIKLIPHILGAYIKTKQEENAVLKTHDDIGKYISARYFGVDDECVSVLCLNDLGKVLSFKIVTHGSIDAVGIDTRAIVERVIKSKASAVVIAHNHPGGVALPSYADVVQTRRIAQILKEFSANLIDHIIVTEEDYVSMAQSSEFKDIFQV